MNQTNNLNGLLLINKQKHWTSNDVVQCVKHKLKLKKVGHCGTLDPLATGLLILGLNDGTKLMNQLLHQNKKYEVEITFHQFTKTFDSEGEITYFEHEKEITVSEFNQAISYFLNLQEYYQTPPAFSAIKINGKKAYELARKNKEVKLEPRLVKILNIENITFDEEIQKLTFVLDCSSGFYVRSFVQDLANYLNVHAIMSNLKRLSINNFDLNQAIDILVFKDENIEQDDLINLVKNKLITF